MPRKQKEQPKGTPARAIASTRLEFLPVATQRAIEEEVEHDFLERALRLLTDLSWRRYRNQVHGPNLAVQEFTKQYTRLLAWAFAEYIGLVAKATANLGVRVPWDKAESAGFYFVDRFVTGAYRHPWTGDFLLGHSVEAYRTLHEVAPWFSVTPDIWERVFIGEVHSGSWRLRAIEDGQRRAKLNVRTSQPKQARTGKVTHAELDAPQWSVLQKHKAIKRPVAAAYLRLSDRTIRDYIRRGKLDATKRGWVVCNGKLLGLLQGTLSYSYR